MLNINLNIQAIPLLKPNNRFNRSVIISNAHKAAIGYKRDNPWLTYAAALATAVAIEYDIAREMQKTNRMIEK